MTCWHADGSVTRRRRPRVKLCDSPVPRIRFSDRGFHADRAAGAVVCSGKLWELGALDVAETSDVVALLSPAPGVPGEYGMRVRDVADMRRRSDVTETRVARRLGIDTETLMVFVVAAIRWADVQRGA